MFSGTGKDYLKFYRNGNRIVVNETLILKAKTAEVQMKSGTYFIFLQFEYFVRVIRLFNFFFKEIY